MREDDLVVAGDEADCGVIDLDGGRRGLGRCGLGRQALRSAVGGR
uniref:Uncharacterized protein n=1 Tax=Arundo donax TaxID=35708 RepID=A0A0A9C0Y3_ARUDO